MDLGPWVMVAIAIALVALAHEVAGPGAAAIVAGAVTATGRAALVRPDLGGPRGRAWVVAAVGAGMALALTLSVIRDPTEYDDDEDATPVPALPPAAAPPAPTPEARRSASLDYADLAGTALQRADLSGADMRYVDLSGADLPGRRALGRVS